jgi:hypothetical protein
MRVGRTIPRLRQSRQGWLFQPLTEIRQTGTQRLPDGTTTYTFVAQVHVDLPPVALALTITPEGNLWASACFDETLRDSVAREEEPR